MRDPFRNYDAWLEAPFQQMCAEQEREAQVVSAAIEAGDLPINPTEEEAAAYLEEFYSREVEVEAEE